MNTQRLLPLGGPVFVAVVLVAMLGLGGSGSPTTDASASELTAFYGDDTWRQAIGALVCAASIPFLILFAVELARTAPAAQRTAWSWVLIAGSVITCTSLAITAMGWFALADAADNDLPGSVLQPLNVLVNNGWVAWNAGLGVMMLGAAGCLWASTGAQRWLARLALVLGVLLFIPFIDFFALLLTLLWLVVVGVMRSRSPLVAQVAVPATAG